MTAPISLEEKIRPDWTALLVIDVQRDYASPDGVLGRGGRDMSSALAILPRLQSLIEVARTSGVYVVFLRNWHRPETDSPAWLDQVARSGFTEATRPGRAESDGAQFFGVAPIEGEAVISKCRYDAFLGTNLEILLRTRGVRTVVCAGVTTNVCVESTARAAHMRDHHVVLVEDCCAAPDPEEHASAVRNISRYFGEVASAAEVTRHWAQVRAERRSRVPASI
jgi:ureidoacrylate peracid hydrolase